MSVRFPVAAVLAAFALAWIAPVASSQCSIEQEDVDAAFQDALIAVQEELGIEIPDLAARLAEQQDLARATRDENLPMLERLLGDEVLARATATQFGAGLGLTAYAKYAWSTREVLVSRDNLAARASAVNMPELCSPEGLRAILVHEVVHAADNDRYDFAACMDALPSMEAVQSFSAVIEGHAQHVARRVCAGNGWLEAFERLTASFDAVPLGLDETDAMMARMQLAQAATHYVDGERFIAAVAEAAGEEGIRRAFTEPPAEPALIFQPAWFLDPDSRPASTVDLDAGLDVLVAAFEGGAWNSGRDTLTPRQLTANMSQFVPEAVIEQVKRMGRTVRRQALVGTPDTSRQIAGALFEFASPGDAAAFIAIQHRLLKAKDESLREGRIRITRADYVPVEGMVGQVAYKEVTIAPAPNEVIRGDTVHFVHVLVAARGPVAVELTYTNVSVDENDLVALGEAMLDTAQRQAVATAAWSFDDVEAGQLPEAFAALETAGVGTPATWRVAEDPDAPSGDKVLRVTAANAGSTFNVLLAPTPAPADVDLSVRLRADSGDEDQGGGLVWRARDADNYYVARWNPLENNLRAYRVKGGRRRMLVSADVELDPRAWHTLRVLARGRKLVVLLDGQELLTHEDETFRAAGRVGLWTKADASVSFDDLELSAAR